MFHEAVKDVKQNSGMVQTLKALPGTLELEADDTFVKASGRGGTILVPMSNVRYALLLPDERKQPAPALPLPAKA